MIPPTVASDWRFPRSAAGIGVLLGWARDRGVDTAALLAGTGVDPAWFGAAGAPSEDRTVTAEQELAVVRALQRALPDDPPSALGDRLGARYHLGSFGVFGFAMLASPTLLAAVDLATRYIDLSFTFAIPRAVLDGARVRVHVDGSALPADVRDLLVARDTRAIAVALTELLPDLPVEVETPEQDGVASSWVCFGVEHLERPLPQGSPAAAAVCERLCAELVRDRRVRTGLTQQVRVLIAQDVAAGAPAAGVAAALGLSERTLRRRLAGEGTSYSELLDEVRGGLAAGLLATTLSLDDVALRLGYAEASSLIHAHRRWTGRTPRAPHEERLEPPAG